MPSVSSLQTPTALMDSQQYQLRELEMPSRTLVSPPRSRAAMSRFSVPVALAACVALGLPIDRGTEARTAWCSTQSMPRTARAHAAGSRTESSMKSMRRRTDEARGAGNQKMHLLAKVKCFVALPAMNEMAADKREKSAPSRALRHKSLSVRSFVRASLRRGSTRLRSRSTTSPRAVRRCTYRRTRLAL